MISKPDSCIGCPFYTKGAYFTPDKYSPENKVTFIAQNPGTDEESGHKVQYTQYFGDGKSNKEYQQVTPEPLIGATGNLFNSRFLPLTGLKRSEVNLSNSIRCRPGHDLGLLPDGLPTLTKTMKFRESKAAIAQALRHCHEAHFTLAPGTKLIVTMGQYSLFQLTGLTDVLNWRGYGLDYKLVDNNSSYGEMRIDQYNDLVTPTKIFVTMHIAALYHGKNKKYFHATLQDFNKIKRLLNNQWPLPLPGWSDTPPLEWPSYAAFDTEYTIDSNDLIRWSLCDTSNNLYCVEAYNTPNDIAINPGSVVLAQNALADIGHLANIVDFTQVTIEDLMLAHSVLYTGEPHSLNYIASIFGAFNRYKHLSHDTPELYSALDAYEPMYIWRTGLIPEFKRDRLSWEIYKKYRLPLIQIIDKAQKAGIGIDNQRLQSIKETIEDRLEYIKLRAREITGDNKFNIGGQKDLLREIYQ